MTNVIFNENLKLKRQLDNLLRRARMNEQKQELFDSFGFEVISANNPAQLRDFILYQMPARFQLQAVILSLIDFERDADKLFYGHDQESKQLFENKLFILDPDKDQYKIEGLTDYPQLGPALLKKYDWMLEGVEQADFSQSAALLPLVRSNKLIGTLFLVSKDVNRYQPGIATTFLQKLSAMTAVAIENCLNQQRLKEIGYQDPLTQAYNRRYFDLRFADEISRALRKNENIACMFLDVDFFKKVNDTYGHHVGDMVLTRLVSLIKEQVRACDIVARYGGEEFAVVLPGVTEQLAYDIAERLRRAVESDVTITCGQGHKVTVSIGLETLSSLDLDVLKVDEIGFKLLEHADQALYSAKDTGRNKVVVFKQLD